MGVRLVAIILFLGAAWDLISTFQGIAQFFDLPIEARINPIQFIFALVVTAVVFGFVIASHLIWNLKSDDLPTLLLKIAWACCLVIDFFTSWAGTSHYVFYNDITGATQAAGLLLATFLIVASSILLSKLVLEKI